MSRRDNVFYLKGITLKLVKLEYNQYVELTTTGSMMIKCPCCNSKRKIKCFNDKFAIRTCGQCKKQFVIQKSRF